VNIIYYSAALTGSGHIVQGISIYHALKRKNIECEYIILNNSPFNHLAEIMGVDHKEIALEHENGLSKENYKSSQIYIALERLNPDILIVDLCWMMLHSFIDELTCKKIFLCRQLSDEAFRVPLPDNPISFIPGQYDLLIKTEPFHSSITMEQINPLIIRNREEIYSKNKALNILEYNQKGGPICFFAFNGIPEEFTKIKKSYSYLEDEGYSMVYSTNYTEGLFPIVDYFNAADLLITGAGYNSFWESVFFEKDTIYVPLPRRFESQQKRIDECSDYYFEENGADQLVDILSNL
jgi:hypothetical protein